jgi:hypothetical protein
MRNSDAVSPHPKTIFATTHVDLCPNMKYLDDDFKQADNLNMFIFPSTKRMLNLR